MSIETKFFGGRIVETKEETRNGEPVGILAGYGATWDIDRGAYGIRDQFVRGAFADSIREHQAKGRPIRLKNQHNELIGGIPIENVREDEVGLYIIGEVNLNLQLGREVMSLARQKVLTDFSIGFSVVEFTEDEGLRKITKAVIFEISSVEEPMNPHAIITEVKGFQNLPLADKNYDWNPAEALQRVQEFTGSTVSPSKEYYKAFLNFDRSFPGQFDSYSESDLIADVIDGKLVAVRKALFDAADHGYNIQHIERYYAKMNMASPFDRDQRQYYTAEDVKDWSTRDIERALRNSGSFSKSAAKIIAGIDKSISVEDNAQNILDELKSLQNYLK